MNNKAYQALREIQAMMEQLPREQRRAVQAEANKVRRVAQTPMGRLALQLVHLELLASTEAGKAQQEAESAPLRVESANGVDTREQVLVRPVQGDAP